MQVDDKGTLIVEESVVPAAIMKLVRQCLIAIFTALSTRAYVSGATADMAVYIIMALLPIIWGQLRGMGIHTYLVELATMVDDDVAQVKRKDGGSPPGAILSVALLCLMLVGCATPGAGPAQTPEQRLYAGLAAYSIALTTAAEYAQSPTADKTIVRRANQANRAVLPFVTFARAHRACAGSSATLVLGTDCSLFVFDASSISASARALRDAAALMLVNGGAAR